MSVATERAFVMVSVMFLAILVNRRAISLRSVALAACVILILRPEALLGPGFQMSFAATTALVASFTALQSLHLPRLPSLLRPLVMTVFSSLVAGLATAPVAAAHFNQVAQLGLVANVLSVPVMGILVMPAAVLAACLAPFGLGWIGLSAMQWGLSWILSVAHWVADMDLALSYTVAPSQVVLPILALGCFWTVFWQGHLRWVGLLPVCAAFLLWAQTDRPLALVASNGGLVGVMTEQGRALSRSKGNGFSARSWLENDGDPALQWQAYGRLPAQNVPGVWHRSLGSTRLRHLTGKAGLAQLEPCRPTDLVILSSRQDVQTECTIYDASRLRRVGSLAIFMSRKTGQLRIVSARDISGDRLWNIP
jgi:competence protein ComEC